MDRKPESVQTAIDSSPQSILPMGDKSCSETSTPVKKLHVHGVQHLDANFVSPTPEKTDETVNMKCKKEPDELPEKYKLLSDFFDRMTTSLRLLNLHKKLPTFHNISRQVEALTGREFSYKNLAQIKFILPEAVQTDRILSHNKKTLCMESDIKVTLHFDVVEGHIEHSAYIALSRVFSSRLFKFINTHSQDCDVPEAELPEPFNQKELKVSTNFLPVKSTTETLPNVDDSKLLNPSHLPPSFTRHFKDVEKSTKTELSPSPFKSDTTVDKETGFSPCLDPFKNEKSLQIATEDTPIKIASVVGEIAIETPDLPTPKRLMSTEDNKLKSILSQKATGSSLFAKRALNFANDDDEGGFLEGKIASPSDSSAKVEDKSCCTSKNDIITQSGLKTNQPTSACLSDIVETIHNIFHSTQCSSITKSELVHKILVNNLDIIEDGEIEEQIELLVNKVPDWISKKVDPSGDFLYTIDKVLDLKTITEKLT